MIEKIKYTAASQDFDSEIPGVATTKIDDAINWLRKYSIWPVTLGLACCAIEMMSTSAARFDISRFGSEVFRASPRQSDLMIVAGRASWKMIPVVRQVYDQMPEPKYVISMGACASCSGVFNNYAIAPGIDRILPVDVYVPGCPPRPEALLQALIMIQDKMTKSKVVLYEKKQKS